MRTQSVMKHKKKKKNPKEETTLKVKMQEVISIFGKLAQLKMNGLLLNVKV